MFLLQVFGTSRKLKVKQPEVEIVKAQSKLCNLRSVANQLNSFRQVFATSVRICRFYTNPLNFISVKIQLPERWTRDNVFLELIHFSE